MSESLSLTDKVALVTGGSGGIGSAISTMFAKQGASVIMTYNSNEKRASTLMKDLPGDNHMVTGTSVTDSAGLQHLAKEIKDRYGRLDFLVNNAGITRPVPHNNLDALDDDLIDSIFQINCRGAIATVRAMQSLLKQNSGVVVNISSIAAQTGIGSNIAYCASKAAINNITISLGHALAPDVRVVAVSPGWVDGEYARQADPAYLQEQIDKTPLSRLATNEDVAQTVLAVITLMPFTTACTIAVDGGRPFN